MALLSLAALTPSCATVVAPGADGPSGLDATNATDAAPGTDAFTPPGTDAAPPGTDAGPGWTPPPSDGTPCAPEACPADAPQCVGPSVDEAFCRATCTPGTPDPCAPLYSCVMLMMGGGACLPAAPDEGCCNVCGCQTGTTCVNLGPPSGQVCLTNCTPPSTAPCEGGESCVMLMGGTTPGACLNTITYPTCSGNPVLEQMCM